MIAHWLVCEDLNHEIHKTEAKAKQNKLTLGDVKKTELHENVKKTELKTPKGQN